MNGMKRTIGRVAAVGAVALLLTGAATATTEARPRSEAMAYAASNGAVCADIGGTTLYYESFSSIGVLCITPAGPSFNSTPYDPFEPEPEPEPE
jgi:hypothetical protein